MVVKLELKLPGTDVGMSIAFGHLDENSNGPSREVPSSPPKPSSGAKVKIVKNDLEESECECEDCSGSSKVKEKVVIQNEDAQQSVDMVTKIFSSLMQCTASNINGNQFNQNTKPNKKTKGLKQINASGTERYNYESEDDSLAKGILGKGCTSDFSVSQSLYPDDILVSYEPKKKKPSKSKKAPAETKSPPLSDNTHPVTRDLKDVRIIPINKSTNAKILPNRKFKESKYDVSCISVPTLCNKARLISCCNTRLVPQVHRCNLSRPEDENLMISVPSAIYPDNIILTLKNPKPKKNKKK
ncbi:uncharacterized protein cubi_00059 [Cryptosporidium ubiquitum]|uniref:Uncharacterized protein n=1 Tax=Cryptosporidium ubiquitum TaxID=857276 RepID=A0A1J4MJR5_9CRYT|nr:uncharacterized protein cubi_00059 [Cryptosporidium ubiquitum]OII74506.1 hypothetical protein cubi_00059 [Cryptosporidium ubiquitum]